MLRILKLWARRLIRDVHAVYLAARDPRVPWYARVLAIAVAGYGALLELAFGFRPIRPKSIQLGSRMQKALLR